MRLVVLPDTDAVAEAGAKMVAAAIAADPSLAVAVATGNSPIALYDRLAASRAAGIVDTARITAVQLDDYVGVGQDDPRSLHGWMHRAFVAPLRLRPDQVLRLDGTAPDLAAECARFDARIEAAGGLGLAILGLGPNGHVGFNEPPSPADAQTRVVDLTPESLASNAGYWGDAPVPRQGITMGMAQILAARQVLLIVTGAHKAAILRRTLDGPPDTAVPASLLAGAARVTVLADRAAAGDAAP